MNVRSKPLKTQAEELHAKVAAIGLPQREIARVLGISQRDFRRYVAGKFPCPPVVRAALEGLMARNVS